MALEEQAAKDVLGNPGSKLHDEAAELWVKLLRYRSVETRSYQHRVTPMGGFNGVI